MAQNFSSFTITQPFLGAPLQFHPALGSQELEQLIDAFVSGSSSKKDKLSEVTIDFYNNASVDLNTGALVRRYHVALPTPWLSQSFEQSPTFSQSSGFSPVTYTPSPASSTAFADSGYGSISLTPPTRNRGSRVSKKAKKETKKIQEDRLPGFSIMTRDGVDVTSTAGRGTKTKEQREHAHLMRIMKACDDCKRKKIRCDPSHRRTDMSRTSTSTTKTSSSRCASVPSLSHETTYPSEGYMTPLSFSTNPIDDFVLFPEDTAFSWNPADMSLDSQGGDLSQFNFDINDIDLEFSNDFPSASMPFDFSFNRQSTFSQQPGYTPLANNQYSLDEWASSLSDELATHTRPHPSSPAQNSGVLDPSWYADSFGSLESASPISTTTCPPTLSSVPGWDSDQSIGTSPTLQTNSSGSSPGDLSSLDWNVYDATPFANASTLVNQNSLNLSDVYADASECDSNELGPHGQSQEGVRTAPDYTVFQKERRSDGGSRSSSLSEERNDLARSYTQSSRLATLGTLRDESTRAAQTVPITAVNATIAQQQKLPLTASAAVQLTNPVIQTVLSRTEDSSRTTSQDKSSGVSSRGAIPRPIPGQQYPPAAGGHDMKCSMLVAIALGASLVILNGLQVMLSSVLKIVPLVLLMSLLPVVFPRQLSSTNTSWICLAILALSSSLSIDVMRETRSQLIDDDAFSAISKLFLCCVVVAQLPSFLWEEMRGHSFLIGTVVNALRIFSFSSCPMSSSPKSLLSKSTSGPFQGKELTSLFGMLSSTVRIIA